MYIYYVFDTCIIISLLYCCIKDWVEAMRVSFVCAKRYDICSTLKLFLNSHYMHSRSFHISTGRATSCSWYVTYVVCVMQYDIRLTRMPFFRVISNLYQFVFPHTSHYTIHRSSKLARGTTSIQF